VPIDASQMIWVATANDLRSIPDPILNRVNVFEIDMPDEAAARKIAAKLYRSIRADHAWGQRFDEELSEPVLGALSHLAPREMRRALMTAFGNAKLDGRGELAERDLPQPGHKRQPIGFAH
jgi:ATP-dependent Lon protease